MYISQVKRKCGLEVEENYNLAKSEDAMQPHCPEEKEKAIVDAMKHFGMACN
jgi:23S rRNA (uracil1939-C5)-methyltransferase